MASELTYNAEQRRQYLNLMDKVCGHWLEVFDGNDVF